MIMIYDFYRVRPFFGAAFPCGFALFVGVISGISDSPEPQADGRSWRFAMFV